MTILIVALALLLSSVPEAWAQPARKLSSADTATVVRVGDRSLTVRSADGRELEMATDTQTRVQRGAQEILLAELNPGDRVVVSARPEGATGTQPVADVVQLVVDEGGTAGATGSTGATPSVGAAAPAGASEMSVVLRGLQGEQHGTLSLRDTHAGLFVRIALTGLPPGIHGFHVHAVGRCEPPFDSAGDHYAPKGGSHGFFAPDGPHAGDLVNLHVGSDGRVEQDLLAPRLRLADLLDADGAAFIVHEGADDYASQPSGGAGARIACAAVQKEPAASP